jgi:hypothetical protein
MCPAWLEQAVPNLTAPRLYQSPGGEGARWAGLDELFFGYRFLRKSVFVPVLPRPQNGPGSSRQAKTWSTRPPTNIVLDESVCAEIGHLFLLLWSTKDGPLDQCKNVLFLRNFWNFGTVPKIPIFWNRFRFQNSKFPNFQIWNRFQILQSLFFSFGGRRQITIGATEK